MQKETGKIHIYAGDGKGKTTAGVGLAVRAAGSGLRVLYTQFLKDGKSSEIKILKEIKQIEFFRGEPVRKFVFAMPDQERVHTKEQCEQYFSEIVAKAESGAYDLLIMDEIIAAMNVNMLDIQEVICFLKKKPQDLEVVLTGRDPAPQLIELADYYSEILARKHPYETEKLQARKGIEF